MAFSLPPRGRRTSRRPLMMSEINVTPMVDVMLVLLVIFMVAAPLLTVGVPVDLPNTKAPTLNAQEEPLVVTYTEKHELFLQETRMKAEELTAHIAAVAAQNPELKVYIRGSQHLPYGDMMALMGDIRAAGVEHVALVGNMPEGQTKVTPPPVGTSSPHLAAPSSAPSALPVASTKVGPRSWDSTAAPLRRTS